MEKERPPSVAASDLRTVLEHLILTQMMPSPTCYCADFAIRPDFNDFSGLFTGGYWALKQRHLRFDPWKESRPYYRPGRLAFAMAIAYLIERETMESVTQT